VAPSRVRERLAPCHADGVPASALCGTYSVWENRTTQRGRKIDLAIVVLPALGEPAPDPIFELAGGPGGSSTPGAVFWANEKALRAHRDIVLVDQRGTGGSHRLDCPVPRDPNDVQAYFEPTLPPAEVRGCRAELERDADLTQYTTSIAADDLDEVRAWLGYDRINLDGGSYGTRAAQVYLRRHGDHVRTANLIGVTAMNLYLPLFYARDGKHALDLLFDECAHDPACHAAFPALADDHAKVLRSLERARGHATVERPVDHHPVQVTIPRNTFPEQIRYALYSSTSASAVPYVLHRAAQGDFTPFARLAMLWEPGLRHTIAFGMHLSVTCAEDVPFFTQDEIDREIKGTYLGGYRVLQQVAACREWRRGEIPADFHAPVTSDVPVLLVSGAYDPVTPPHWAEQVAPHYAHGLHLLVPYGHHGADGLSNPGCLDNISVAFIERGTTEGLDTSCVSTMMSPPFIVDDAGFAGLVKRSE
jgi:pimeloyl-ACP methyl ester carboxylesterase